MSLYLCLSGDFSQQVEHMRHLGVVAQGAHALVIPHLLHDHTDTIEKEARGSFELGEKTDQLGQISLGKVRTHSATPLASTSLPLLLSNMPLLHTC
jgi:hypothetical protein